MKQHEKIILHMLQGPKDRAWRAADFQPPALPFDHACFVGYEATARMSEVANNYPELVEKAKDGKYRTLTIRWSNLAKAVEVYSDVEKLARDARITIEGKKTRYDIYMRDGLPRCTCPGYFYRKKCRHVDEYLSTQTKPLL